MDDSRVVIAIEHRRTPSNTVEHHRTPSNTVEHRRTLSNTVEHHRTLSNTVEHRRTPTNKHHKGNTMLSWNVMTLRLLLVCAALPAIIAYNLPYTTVTEKSVAGYKLTEFSSFSIPENQCSGFIDESLLCGAEGVPGAVRVAVREGASFATVRIQRHLRNATVLRARDAWGACAGAAEVDVLVGCLVPPPPHVSRTRRSLATLPPVPSSSHREY